MYSKFIKLVVLLSLLVCCGFAQRVLCNRFFQLCRTRERSTSQLRALVKQPIYSIYIIKLTFQESVGLGLKRRTRLSSCFRSGTALFKSFNK